MQLADFLQSFTFLTDLASTMHVIAGASSSSDLLPFSDKWVGCIAHQLKKAINNCIYSEEKDQTFLSKDLASVKIVVCVFKHGNWNSDMRNECAIFQESETRFVTIYSFVVRFLKSVEEVLKMVLEEGSQASSMALSSLVTNYSVTGD